MSVSEVSGFDPAALAAEARARADADIARADSLNLGKKAMELIARKLEVSSGGYVVLYEDELRDVTGAEHPKIMGEQFIAAAAETDTAARQRLGVARAARDTADFLLRNSDSSDEVTSEVVAEPETEDRWPESYIHRY